MYACCLNVTGNALKPKVCVLYGCVICLVSDPYDAEMSSVVDSAFGVWVFGEGINKYML